MAKFEFKVTVHQYTMAYGQNAPSCDPLKELKTWVQEVCKSIFGEIELNTFLGSPTCNKYQNASYF